MLAACSAPSGGGAALLGGAGVGGGGGTEARRADGGSEVSGLSDGGLRLASDSGSRDLPAHLGTGGSAPPSGAARDASTDASDAEPQTGPSPTDAGAPTHPLDAELRLRLESISERLAPLAARTWEFWRDHGPDPVFGGFHATLNRQGNPSAPEDKGLVQQMRHLWMLSTWYERREATPEVRQLADRQYAFVRQSFVDAADGAFILEVSRQGNVRTDSRKQMYAECYALYALASYGRVFGIQEATDLALQRFLSIDASRHDVRFGGYDQRGDPGFLSPGAEKDTNTHLHLMEALTVLYDATADARVAARLNELVDLIASTLRQPPGYVPTEFSLSWVPFGAPRVSYGHDLETAWLILEAARALGRQGDVALRSASLELAAYSSSHGFDAVRGGFFEIGTPAGAVTDFDKVWWVQFEALAGLWWAYELSGDPAHLDRLTATLGWIEATEDRPSGEWFATTNPDGTAAGLDYKGDEYKASYHTLRALLFVKDWIDAELARHSAP